jgi:pimeloyl-ACP methyl ester carboxylesterase
MLPFGLMLSPSGPLVASMHVREYGAAGPCVIVLHGGPGAAGSMARVARELADMFRVVEPFQRESGGERLTVARHVADLHEVMSFYANDRPPALLGSSWGAMLALAYAAAAHPDATGPLVLVGCGTFDPVARAALQSTVAKRMDERIRVRLKEAEHVDLDRRWKARAEAMAPVYSIDLLNSPHDEETFDAQAHHETWDDMLRLQNEGVYPAAFAAIRVPLLMVHGDFDPHPGRLIFNGLQHHLPQIDYVELEQCGHYPWLEKAAAGPFFACVRAWLGRHMLGGGMMPPT